MCSIKTLAKTMLMLTTMSLMSHAVAAETNSKEGKLKTAYLFNFLRFIEWPDDSNRTINLCVIGDKASYHNSLLSLETQSLNNNAINVDIYEDINSEESIKLEKCQLIFFTDLITKKENVIIKVIQSSPILTVGENSGFMKHGGMINFVQSNDKIRFEINMIAVKKTDIRVSSKILRLAERVIE
jgi:uncharacterized protein DUF4154